MKRKNLRTVPLLIALVLLSCTGKTDEQQKAYSEEQTSIYTIEIHTNPDYADIWVNHNRVEGSQFSVSEGTHFISIQAAPHFEPITNKEIDVREDGIYEFHLQRRTLQIPLPNIPEDFKKMTIDEYTLAEASDTEYFELTSKEYYTVRYEYKDQVREYSIAYEHYLMPGNQFQRQLQSRTQETSLEALFKTDLHVLQWLDGETPDISHLFFSGQHDTFFHKRFHEFFYKADNSPVSIHTEGVDIFTEKLPGHLATPLITGFYGDYDLTQAYPDMKFIYSALLKTLYVYNIHANTEDLYITAESSENHTQRYTAAFRRTLPEEERVHALFEMDINTDPPFDHLDWTFTLMDKQGNILGAHEESGGSSKIAYTYTSIPKDPFEKPLRNQGNEHFIALPRNHSANYLVFYKELERQDFPIYEVSAIFVINNNHTLLNVELHEAGAYFVDIHTSLDELHDSMDSILSFRHRMLHYYNN